MTKAYQICNGMEKADWEGLLIISSSTKTKPANEFRARFWIKQVSCILMYIVWEDEETGHAQGTEIS